MQKILNCFPFALQLSFFFFNQTKNPLIYISFLDFLSSIKLGLTSSSFLMSLCRKSRVFWPTGKGPIWLDTGSWFLKERFVCSEPKMKGPFFCLTSCCWLQRSEKKHIHTRLTSWSVIHFKVPHSLKKFWNQISLTWFPTFLLQCCNLMLVEVIPKEPLSFSVFHYKNPKLQHTVQVRPCTNVKQCLN